MSVYYDNIILKPSSTDDFEYLKQLYSYADIIRYCTVDSKKIEELCHQLCQHEGVFIIQNFLAQNVGYISVGIAPFITFSDSFWLQYAIEPMFRNCGYATSAIKAIINELNNSPMPIALLIDNDNVVSQRVAIKCGFRQTNFENGIKSNGEKTVNETAWVLDDFSE